MLIVDSSPLQLVDSEDLLDKVTSEPVIRIGAAQYSSSPIAQQDSLRKTVVVLQVHELPSLRACSSAFYTCLLEL